MKFATITLVLPLFVANISPVAGQFGLGWFSDVAESVLGEDDKPPEKEKKLSKAEEEEASEFVVQSLQNNAVTGPVFTNLGSYLQGSGAAGTEVSEGRRAYNCIMKDANSGGTGRMMPLFATSAVETIAYGVLYHSFSSPEDINVICPPVQSDAGETDAGESVAESGGGERRALRTVNNKKENLRRRVSHGAHGAVPNYPYLDPADLFTGGERFEVQNVQLNKYLSGDMNDRLAIGALRDDLNEQIVVYQTNSQNLQVTGEIITALGEFISTVIPEAGIGVAGVELDVGATIRGLGTFIQAIATATATNVARRQRTLLKIETHMALIDSAEIEAAYKNSDALIAKLADLEAQVAELQTARFFDPNP